jgi:hypothetical protein
VYLVLSREKRELEDVKTKIKIMNNAKKFLGMALVLSVLSIWGVAQTNQTATQKAGTGIDETQSKSVTSLTNSQLLSSAGTIIATNNGVTITQSPGTSIPEGPEPQGGWFTPLYRAEGTMLQEMVSVSSGNVIKTWTNGFAVSLDNNRHFKITLAQDNGFSECIASDGTNIYTFLAESVNEDHGTVFSIIEGLYPVSNSQAIGLLWMAYVSGEFLEDPHFGGRVPNVISGMTAMDPTASCVDLKYTLESYAHNTLLTKGEFVLNKSLVSENLYDYPFLMEPISESTREQWLGMLKELKQAVPEDCVLSAYALKNSVVAREYHIPVAFQSEAYSTPLSQEEILNCRFRVSGMVTNIILDAPRRSLLPLIHGVASVSDDRFRVRDKNFSRDRLDYLVTNAWELDTNSARLQELSNRLIPRPHLAPPKDMSHYVRIGLLTVVILAPLGFFVIRRWRKQG